MGWDAGRQSSEALLHGALLQRLRLGARQRLTGGLSPLIGSMTMEAHALSTNRNVAHHKEPPHALEQWSDRDQSTDHHRSR